MYRIAYIEGRSSHIAFTSYATVEDAFNAAKQLARVLDRSNIKIVKEIADVVPPSVEYVLRYTSEAFKNE